jgi:hypothetical protein
MPVESKVELLRDVVLTMISVLKGEIEVRALQEFLI